MLKNLTINNKSKSSLQLNQNNNSTKSTSSSNNGLTGLTESSSTLLILPSSTQLSVTSPNVASITSKSGHFNAGGNSSSTLSSSVASSSDNLAFNYYQQKLRKINKAKVATANQQQQQQTTRATNHMSQSYNADVIIPIMLSSDLKLPPRPQPNSNSNKPPPLSSSLLNSNIKNLQVYNNSFDSNDSNSCSNSSSASISSISIHSNVSNHHISHHTTKVNSSSNAQVIPLKCEKRQHNNKPREEEFYYYTNENDCDMSNSNVVENDFDETRSRRDEVNKEMLDKTTTSNKNNYDFVQFANEKIMINNSVKKKNFKFFEIHNMQKINNHNNKTVCSSNHINNNNNSEYDDYDDDYEFLDDDDTNCDSLGEKSNNSSRKKRNIVIIKIDNNNNNSKSSKNNDCGKSAEQKQSTQNLKNPNNKALQKNKLATHSTSSLAASNANNQNNSVLRRPEAQSFFSVINLNTSLSKSILLDERCMRDSLDNLPGPTADTTKLYSSTRSLAMQTSTGTTTTTQLSSAKVCTFLGSKVSAHASQIEPTRVLVHKSPPPPPYEEFKSSVKFIPAPVSQMSASYNDKVYSRPPLPVFHSSTSIYDILCAIFFFNATNAHSYRIGCNLNIT
jgi:hypothetical protein